jgi:hypothetical protein
MACPHPHPHHSQLSDKIVLTEKNTYDFHCGEVIDGRFYRRTKSKLQKSVDNVALVKDEHPKAKDVMKAAVNIDFLSATYQQSYRAIHRLTSEVKVKNERSYQLLIPYMKKFVETNPDSTALAERDHNNNVQRLFVCPGIMQEAL